ncbi:MAG: GGDEF domain-containing protein [Thermoanaerobaculia bacterium]|nr:GGDEF domain-containing protein [Thermoanaerobaculia bacterium]
MWIPKPQLATLLFALTAASFGILALTLLGIARGRLRLALYAVLALGVATLLAAPLLFDADMRPRVERGLAVSLPLVAAVFLVLLARGGRGTRAFLFAASSVLALAALAELAARRQVFVAAPLVSPLGAGFVLFTALLLPRVAEQERRLFTRATTDPLTGLLNRAAFEDRAQAELARAGRTGRSLALAMLDLDRFKSFNDRYGHPAGDAALTAVARAIERTVRGIDAAGRYGGEEFIVLFVEADADAALPALERIRAAVGALGPPRVARPITVSAGVAVHQGLFEKTSFKSLVARADAALYRAKKAGRDRVAVEEMAPPATPGDVLYR